MGLPYKQSSKLIKLAKNPISLPIQIIFEPKNDKSGRHTEKGTFRVDYKSNKVFH